MAIGYFTLTAAADPQTVCTLFEAEANITACTVAGTAREADTSKLFPDTIEKGTVTIDATGGTFDIGAAGDLEADVAEDASSATIQAALRALDSFGDTLTVTGDGPHIVTLATTDPTIVVDGTDLTGGAGTVVYAITQTPRSEEVLVFPGQVVFKVVGTTVAAIDTAAAALITDTTAYPIEASGYPETAI